MSRSHLPRHPHWWRTHTINCPGPDWVVIHRLTTDGHQTLAEQSVCRCEIINAAHHLRDLGVSLNDSARLLDTSERTVSRFLTYTPAAVINAVL